MLEFISGRIDTLSPTLVVVEANGLGYAVNISLTTYSALQQQQQQTVKLYIHEILREDAFILYGFIDNAERELFRLLISVSGVGANTARMILSSLPPAQLQLTITSGDSRALKAIKGIGAKTAERIIVDLKDKIKPDSDTLTIQPLQQSADFEEALAALLMLGFPKPQSLKVLKKLFDADPTLKVETAIKKALSML